MQREIFLLLLFICACYGSVSSISWAAGDEIQEGTSMTDLINSISENLWKPSNIHKRAGERKNELNDEKANNSTNSTTERPQNSVNNNNTMIEDNGSEKNNTNRGDDKRSKNESSTNNDQQMDMNVGEQNATRVDDDNNSSDGSNKPNNTMVQENNKNFNNTDENDDDEEEEFYFYPCKYSNQEDCIRHYLASHSHCSPVHRYKHKDTFYREKAVLYFPNFNFTVTLTDSRITGLDGMVEKFYINRKTRNLVYAVDFKSINMDAKVGYFEFHRRGKEPKVAHDYVIVTYAPTVLTAVIPLDYSGMSLKGAKITADISNVPAFKIGPKVTNNPDPQIRRTVLSYMANLPTAVRELFLTESYNFFIAYLQNYICDFDFKV